MATPRLRRDPLDTIEGIPVFAESDRYTRNYDQIAQDHLASGEDGNNNPFIDDLDWRIMEDSTTALLSSVAQPGQSILDLGVGTGRLLENFPQLARSGVDISIDYLRLLADKSIQPYLARSEDLPFVDASFDLVISTDVLEHVIDLDATFKEIYRVLKPGGYLITRVPYRENLAPYLAPSYPYQFVHLRNFDEHGLELMLCHVYGFDKIRDAYANIMTPPKLRLPQFWLVVVVMARIRRLLARSRAAYEWCAGSLYRPIAITTLVRKPLEDAATDQKARA